MVLKIPRSRTDCFHQDYHPMLLHSVININNNDFMFKVTLLWIFENYLSCSGKQLYVNENILQVLNLKVHHVWS